MDYFVPGGPVELYTHLSERQLFEREGLDSILSGIFEELESVSVCFSDFPHVNYSIHLKHYGSPENAIYYDARLNDKDSFLSVCDLGFKKFLENHGGDVESSLAIKVVGFERIERAKITNMMV